MNKILVRFGELSTKGNNKMTFVRRLATNIERVVGEKPGILFDRIFLSYKKETVEKLRYVFGIYSYSPCYEIPSSKEDFKNTIDKIMEDDSFKTFKITSKRHYKKFPFTSNELNIEMGSYVVEKYGLKVSLKEPDVNIEIEVRENKTYIFSKRIKSVGGYPAGINGKVLHLMSGGIDSPVAAYELMKRGIHVDYLNFVTPPHTDEKTVDKVNRLVKKLAYYQGKATIYRINYTKLLNLLGLTSDQGYKINLMRRSFFRIADKIAKDKKYLGISSGENIGQVASQTLESLQTISEMTLLPIYRPVLTNDKIDTINQAVEIGTYELSIEKANESCELFAPKKPVIKPTSWVAAKLEKELEGLLDIEEELLGQIEKKEIT